MRFDSVPAAYLAVHQLRENGCHVEVIDECCGSFYGPLAIGGIRVLAFPVEESEFEDAAEIPVAVIEERETSPVQLSAIAVPGLGIFIGALMGLILSVAVGFVALLGAIAPIGEKNPRLLQFADLVPIKDAIVRSVVQWSLLGAIGAPVLACGIRFLRTGRDLNGLAKFAFALLCLVVSLAMAIR